MLRELLAQAVKARASDVHLAQGLRPVFRIDGELRSVDFPAVSDETVRTLLDLLTPGQRAEFDEELDVDLSINVERVGRFRVNILQEESGIGAAFRTIPSVIPSFDLLGLPVALRQLCRLDKGLVLVTGPAGVGKTTTLAAMIDLINECYACHIITIEDPIEFTHQPKMALIRQREINRHTASFGRALRAALREDPDVIFVGELRDLETIRLALTAAETGHLVLGTLHSPGAVQTVDRIVDVFPPVQQNQIRLQFADVFEGIIAQRLHKRSGGGRIASFEVLLGTPAARNLIREAKSHQLSSVMQAGRGEGMQTMDSSVAWLIEQGLIATHDGRPLPTRVRHMPVHVEAEPR